MPKEGTQRRSKDSIECDLNLLESPRKFCGHAVCHSRRIEADLCAHSRTTSSSSGIHLYIASAAPSHIAAKTPKAIP